jgi:AraC-like DNA-binding protein
MVYDETHETVIDQRCFLIDQTFGDATRFLTATGLRLDDVRARIEVIAPQQEIFVGEPHRAFFIHAVKGDVSLLRKEFNDTHIPQHGSVGLERGPNTRLINRSSNTPATVLISSINQRHAFIQQLPEGMLAIGPNVRPFSDIIRASVLILIMALEQADQDFGVVRRMCEVIMLQLLRYVQRRSSALAPGPEAIKHDAILLRAWTAFFANPSAHWTIDKLARASGLGRSAFIARFKAAFDAPPKTVLTRMRMEQAKYLLRKPGIPLIEIAFDIGYGSEAAFIRAFKREYGAPPGKWRQARKALAHLVPMADID